MAYLYVKIFHIVAFVSWMAMLFYLPRLFVYHAEHLDNAGFVEVVKTQEEKLFNFIGYPALFCTLLSGVWLIILEPSWLSGGWLHAKILIVLLLVAYHYSLYRFLVAFRENRCLKSGKFFRAYNEVPTLAIIFITILVIIKPF